MTEDDLKSINDFDKYTKFIQNFILSNNTLWKLIFYPYSSPLSDEKAVDPQDPYTIFSRELGSDGKLLDSHGVVLFDDKDDTIQNSSNVTLLISFESNRLGDSNFLDTNRIIFQLICKGSEIRKLSNGKDRVDEIFDLIDNEFNMAKINNISEVSRMSYGKLSLNEENVGKVAIYKCIGASRNLNNNKNYLKKRYGSPDGR